MATAAAIGSSSSNDVMAAAAAMTLATGQSARHAACTDTAGGGAQAAEGVAALPPQLSGGHAGVCFLLDGMLGRLCRWLRCLVRAVLAYCGNVSVHVCVCLQLFVWVCGCMGLCADGGSV